MVENDYFYNSQKVFKLYLIWSSAEGTSKSLMARLLKWVVFISTGVIMTIVSLSDTIDEMQHGEIISTFSKALYLMALAVCSHKLYAAAFNEDKICACVKQIERLSSRFKDTSDIKECLGIYRKLFFVGTFGIGFVTFLFMVGPLTTNEYRPLTYAPKLPYINVVKTPNWQLFYIYEIIVLLLITTTTMAYDTLFCGMMCLSSGILSSMCREIREFEDTIENNHILVNKMKEIVDKLNEISQLTTKISDTFSLTSITHIMYNCSTIALGLLMVSLLPPNSTLFFTMIMAIAVEGFQLWIYCYFGQNLVSQREVLQRELYFIRWYDASKNIKTMLRLTIFESQNDRYIYAGKLMPLSLTTFSEVFKNAYAFFTFLNNSSQLGEQ